MTRSSSPAAERNREPILAVLRELLPESGSVLEVASGTGQHIVHFARAMPGLRWQPSDVDPNAIASVRAWLADELLDNVDPPVLLDTTSDDWPVAGMDVVWCANMTHISPWQATLGLLAGSARVLVEGGQLILYGPYVRSDCTTAASNEAFDRSLRSRDSSWGLRHHDQLVSEAAVVGLDHQRIVDMPANNIITVFRRR